MKKILIVLLACILLTGCSINRRGLSINIIRTSYGTYSIPSTWEKNEGHSSSVKYFFTNKNDRNQSLPNNISVEQGSNHYSKKQHVMFRQAIMRQLLMQAKAYKADVKGSGGTTDNGYTYYTFIMEGKTNTTVQHYIIGDYKYVLIHETIFKGDGKDTHNAAKHILNSFRWR